MRPALNRTESPRGNLRAIAAFHHLLCRRPEPDELVRFGALCGSRSGFIRCWLALGLSAESRSRPRLLSRLVKGLVLDGVPPIGHAASLRGEGLAGCGVNLVGYIATESGMGEAVRAFARAATSAGIPHATVDVGHQSPHRALADATSAPGERQPVFDIDVLHVNPEHLEPTFADLRSQNHRSRASIGFWAWEQPQLPLRYLERFRGLAEIWVPSAFVHEAVARIAPVPVFKVPYAIDFRPSPGAGRKAFGLPANAFAVLVMYDFHSVHQRKNPEAAIEAFRRSGATPDNAVLVIKTVNAAHFPEQHAVLKESVADLANVLLLDGYLTRQQVYDLESCCDCMLSLHRAEGFGFGLAEMMYLGKPVIATGWSGNMEFMTPMNSLPVHYRLAPLQAPLSVYEPGQLWAEADIDHAAACLRRLLDSPALAGEIGARAAQSIHEQLSPQSIGRQYRARLDLLVRRLDFQEDG